MTREEFQVQIARLQNTWPHPSNWSDEKLKLIWAAVHGKSVLWLEKVVTSMIASNKSAPTPAQFIEAERASSRRDLPFVAQAAFQKTDFVSVFTDEERGEFWKVLRAVMDNKISKDEAVQYSKMVYEILLEKGVKLDYFINAKNEIVFKQNPII